VIDLGSSYLVAFDVFDDTNTLANVTTVTLTITKPDGTTVTPAVTNPPAATGKYRLTYLPDKVGHYEWAAVTSQSNTGWGDAFDVRIFRSLMSLADAREYLGILDSSRDQVLRSLLTGVTRHIERRIGTCIAKTITDEFVYGDTLDMIRLQEGPLLSASSVTSIASAMPGGPSWATADLVADPAAGCVYPKDGTFFWGGPWLADYTAGRQVIPDDVLEGAKAALWDLWAPQRGISADMLEPSLTEVSDYESAIPPGWVLPGRVKQLIDGEHEPGFA
jgi:hypothetical protein